jgi:mannitol-1-phosphate 5-dehydrogenase
MKKAVMYGAGNIGRGFIAQLFYQSGYETVFIDINEELVCLLNRDGSYPIYITAGDKYEVFTVKNLRAVNGKDEQSVASEIASAHVCATAVGANVLKHIARPVARGISLRCEKKAPPLNIIMCENLLDADKYFRSLVNEHLDETEKAYFSDTVGCAEASIGRMVPVPPEHIRAANPLAVCVEPYGELPVDRAGLKGEIPQIVNLRPFEPFGYYIRRKLYMHNMSHALIAYMGYLRGYKYIWQAAADYEIRYTAIGALIESAAALSKEYDTELSGLIDYSYELLDRFDNKLLGDTVERVGRDTGRKLSPDDRIAGTVALCRKHKIAPRFIMTAAAAALKFNPENDADSAQVAAFARDKGVAAALSRYSGIEDRQIVDAVAELYDGM